MRNVIIHFSINQIISDLEGVVENGNVNYIENNRYPIINNVYYGYINNNYYVCKDIERDFK